MDGVNWIPLTNNRVDIDKILQWYNVDFAFAVTARYVKFTMYMDGDGSAYKMNIYEIKGRTVSGISKKLVMSTKNLATNITYVKAYLSVYVPNASVGIVPKVAKNGVTMEAMTLLSTRTDPQYPAFVEQEYEVNLSAPGNILGFEVTLNPSGIYIPLIKKYGLHWS